MDDTADDPPAKYLHKASCCYIGERPVKVDVLLIHPPPNLRLRRRPIMNSEDVGYGLLHIAASLPQRGYKVSVWNLEGAFWRGASPRDIQRGMHALKGEN